MPMCNVIVQAHAVAVMSKSCTNWKLIFILKSRQEAGVKIVSHYQTLAKKWQFFTIKTPIA